MQNKILTIGIPTYNDHSGLRKVLTSIFSQTTPQMLTSDIEILVSDNSTDNKIEELLNSEFSNRNIVYIKNQKNIFYDRNIDQVLTKSTGLFCWTLSNNDPIEKDCLANLVKVINQNAEANHIFLDFEDNSVTKENTIKKFDNYPNFLEQNNYNVVGGLISQNIFNKKTLPQDRSKYFGNEWIHVSTFLEITADKPFIVIKNCLAKDPNNICQWANNGKGFTTFNKLFKLIKESNLGKVSKDKLLNAMVSDLPRNTASAKIWGLKFKMNNILILFKNYHQYPTKLISSLFIYLTPSSILILFKKWLKK